MKTRIELISEDQNEEVVIKCYQITDEIQSVISFIENEKRIIGYKRGTAYLLNINDILTKSAECRQNSESSKYGGRIHKTRVRDKILKSKEQKTIQPTKGGHKMVTYQNYVSLFYCQITSCPSDGGIS